MGNLNQNLPKFQMNSFATKAIAARAVRVTQTETGISGFQNKTEHHKECDHIGTPFLYLGPSDHKPEGFADITPGMNLAQTNSGAQAPPENIHDPEAERLKEFAQTTNKSTLEKIMFAQ